MRDRVAAHENGIYSFRSD